MDLKDYILDVQDFPIKGVTFKDITPLLNNVNAFKYAVDQMAEYVKQKKANVVVAPEARGFLFASAVAYVAGVRFALIRKPGKLPREVIDVEYELEYGKNHIQIHKEDLKESDNVVIIDDVLATGGTIHAIIKLIEQCKAKINGIVFLADISFLHDKDLFSEFDINCLIKY
ncbi:adenine phosphoribosyltransferase [Spiroplasma tabanidicola]|uniref:Adenine phosphoribosyltransferase n=1 Tax=Spiroplasma tabanidicola TaxID=324079 RepID=A0A6I6CCM0_9MOLU|nr:adenine phosphoribosyltransferase [Spiroplasma tabanidicola]QGS51882.1 adenine phosphoribosyltransferase [Spiroplasma tabanidicola]